MFFQLEHAIIIYKSTYILKGGGYIMARKPLDLSSALSPLKDELKETVAAICPIPLADPFDRAIESFAIKYGRIHFQSIDELLEASAIETQYQPTLTENTDFGLLLKDLLPA